MGKLLYFPILSYGHFNVGIALANHLLDKYGKEHEVYFLVDSEWEQKLKKQNPRFNYKVYKNPMENFANEMSKSSDDKNQNKELTDRDMSDPLEQIVQEASKKDPLLQVVATFASNGKLTPKEQALKSWGFFSSSFGMIRKMEDELVKIIEEINPDLILTDQLIPMPFIIKRNIPWAMVLSANPLLFGLDELPPFSSGLRMDQKNEWIQFRTEFASVMQPGWNVINDWLVEYNCRPLRPNYIMYESPFFNIYCFPKELDYEVPLPGKWFRLDSAIAPSKKITKIDLPESFLKLPGKLIYFSMGSAFSAYLPMMHRLVNLLEHIPHKFIVSKGQLGEHLNLPKNCWGENFLDQKSVLNTVDLIISHGGNNTTNECFHFGVPMIILPVCADQHDNATRLKEMGLGFSLNTFTCTKEELEEAINSFFDNPSLIEKWKNAAARIQNDNGTEAVTQEILKYLNKNN